MGRKALTKKVVAELEQQGPLTCPELAARLEAAPREVLSVLRDEAVKIDDLRWNLEEKNDMAKKKATGKQELLKQLIAAKKKRGGSVVPDDVEEEEYEEEEEEEDEEDEEEEEDEEDEEEEDEDEEDLGYDLDVPLSKWKVKNLRAYLQERGFPGSGKKVELRKMAEVVMASESEVDEPEEDPEEEVEEARSELNKAMRRTRKQVKKGKKRKKKPVQLSVEEDEEDEEEIKLPPKKSRKPEPDEKAWGTYWLFIDCVPLDPPDGPASVLHLSDLLDVPRQLVAESDEYDVDFLSGYRHWNQAKYAKGASMVAAVFRGMLDEGMISIDGASIVCRTGDPGQAEAIQVLFPKRAGGAVRG